MPSQLAATAYSVIYVGTLETNSNYSVANQSLGTDTQASLVTNGSGRKFFQPLFDPSTYNTDPVTGNRRQSFTFWRTDFLDRSYANTKIGSQGGGDNNEGTLGEDAGTSGAAPNSSTTWVMVALRNVTTGNTEWSIENDFVAEIAPGVTQIKRLRAGYNFACMVNGTYFTLMGDDEPPQNGPLNVNNYGWSTAVVSNGTTIGKGVYPGYRCGV